MTWRRRLDEFICGGNNCVFNAFLYLEPVRRYGQDWRTWYRPRCNISANKSILDVLKATIIHGVAVVKSEVNKSCANDASRIKLKNRADASTDIISATIIERAVYISMLSAIHTVRPRPHCQPWLRLSRRTQLGDDDVAQATLYLAAWSLPRPPPLQLLLLQLPRHRCQQLACEQRLRSADRDTQLATAVDRARRSVSSWTIRVSRRRFRRPPRDTETPVCTLALPWPLWYLGACRMLSYPPHSAQQQATAPMSLAFPGQTQHQQQQQQQCRDEQSTDKTSAVGDEELQKPLKVRHDYYYFCIFAISLFEQLLTVYSIMHKIYFTNEHNDDECPLHTYI